MVDRNHFAVIKVASQDQKVEDLKPQGVNLVLLPKVNQVKVSAIKDQEKNSKGNEVLEVNLKPHTLTVVKLQGDLVRVLTRTQFQRRKKVIIYLVKNNKEQGLKDSKKSIGGEEK